MFLNINTHMDYSGQKLAEKIFQRILIFFSVIGFAIGYLTEQISYSMYVLGIGFIVAALVTLPPWSLYRRDPIKWQKHAAAGDASSNAASKLTKKRH